MFWKSLIFWALVLLFGCEGKKSSGKRVSVLNSRGSRLAEKYCTSCHLHARPELLDRSSWIRVLGAMEKEMEKASVHIENEDWLDIQRYYLEASPLTLERPGSKTSMQAGNLFQRTNYLDSVPDAIPFTTMIKYDRKRDVLYSGDISGNVFQFDGSKYVEKIRLNNIPIDIEFLANENSLDVLAIGNMMPSEAKKGQLIRVDMEGNQKTIIDSLARPVHFIREDFNADGESEYLISCFGSINGRVNTGKLTMFTLSNGTYSEKVIKQLPGAIKAVSGDFNNDGRPDIIALFAQGREVISMFLNKGNLEFEEKPLLEFVPVYGSNDFELVDINRDSYPDIVFTNGDNGDNTPVFKYYHGVRIFINDGNYGFKEQYFYPVNGASQVLVRDFDADGELDMMVLAMYPDLFSWSEEMLIYFKNLGDLNFKPTYIEKEPSGKWLRMDAGDIDADGDEDLIIGINLRIKSVLLPPKYKAKWSSSKTSYAVFKNGLFSKGNH